MFLGLDLGTGSLKALLLDEQGEVVAESARSYAVNAPQPAWAESEPQAWWQALCDAVHALEPKLRRAVRAIGFSGQMHGVVLSDAQGHALRPAILWADGRGSHYLPRYQALDTAQRLRLANPLSVGMAGLSLLWLQDHESDLYRAARWALQPKDWLRYQLTGSIATDPSDASATLLYDLQADSWAEDIVEALGLRSELFAPLCASSAVAGQLRPDIAASLGLSAGIPVAAGAGDAAAAALGSGLLQAGDIQLTAGSAAQIVAIRSDATIDPLLRSHLYRSASPAGYANYYAMAAMQNAGLALEWVRQLLGYDWPNFTQAAFGCDHSPGLYFLPYLTGERTPHLNAQARGNWLGLHLGHSGANLARAAFEGVAFALRDGLAALQDVGIDPEALRLAGGGTLEPRWRQLLAAILHKPLQPTAVSSASARGAALLAGLACQHFQPEDLAKLRPKPEEHIASEPRAELDEAYAAFRDLYTKLYS